MRPSAVTASLCLALWLGGLVGPPIVPAQVSLPALTADLRVEWDLGKDRKGNPALSGYVYNARAGYWAAAVHLRITGTDRTGRVTVDTSAQVYGDVPPGGRSYFEVRVPTWDLIYHVTVTGVDFRAYGTGA